MIFLRKDRKRKVNRKTEKEQWQNPKKNSEKYDSVETVFYIAGWLLAVIIFVLFLLWKFTGFTISAYLPSCMFHLQTGLYCPGCGGTRAVYALLRGDILTSLFYYPCVVYAAVIGIWFMISQTIERLSRHTCLIGLRFRPVYLWIALILILGNCLVKNIVLLGFGVRLLA